MQKYLFTEENNKFKLKYRIQSNRHPEWNYSDNWCYFVTICTKDRIDHFWEIINWKMLLNDAWRVIKNEILNTQIIRNNVEIDEYVIMPNHVHVIIIIDNTWYIIDNKWCKRRDKARLVSTWKTRLAFKWKQQKNWFQNPWKWTLWTIIWSFKSSCTKQINKKHKAHSFNFVWQSNYHDRIIRNEKELNTIRRYIKNNPMNWDKDEYFE